MANTAPARRFTIRSLAVGLLGLSAGASFAQAPSPSAKLLPPQPVTPAGGAMVSRAAAPDFTAFDPNKPMAPSFLPPAPKPDSDAPRPLINWWTPPAQPQAPAARPTPPPLPTPMAPVPATAESKSFIGEAWTGVKELVVGKPSPNQPVFARPSDPPATRPVSPTPTTTANTGVYAGPPAYRWYGWGTTTPGANPYAPTGQSPNGSASWYAQTGATPGAFPAPPPSRREAQGWEPPAYARVPATSVEAVNVAATSPVENWPVAPLPAPSMPSAMPSPVIPAAMNPSGLVWQPAGGATQPFSPISSNAQPLAKPGVPAASTIAFRAQAPQTPTPVTLDEIVKDAAKGWAIVELVKSTGPGKISVYLVTSTEAAARAAAEAISRLPQLRQYEVTFEARVK